MNALSSFPSSLVSPSIPKQAPHSKLKILSVYKTKVINNFMLRNRQKNNIKILSFCFFILSSLFYHTNWLFCTASNSNYIFIQFKTHKITFLQAAIGSTIWRFLCCCKSTQPCFYFHVNLRARTTIRL